MNNARDVEAVGSELLDFARRVEWIGNASLRVEQGQSDDDR